MSTSPDNFIRRARCLCGLCALCLALIAAGCADKPKNPIIPDQAEATVAPIETPPIIKVTPVSEYPSTPTPEATAGYDGFSYLKDTQLRPLNEDIIDKAFKMWLGNNTTGVSPSDFEVVELGNRYPIYIKPFGIQIGSFVMPGMNPAGSVEFYPVSANTVDAANSGYNFTGAGNETTPTPRGSIYSYAPIDLSVKVNDDSSSPLIDFGILSVPDETTQDSWDRYFCTGNVHARTPKGTPGYLVCAPVGSLYIPTPQEALIFQRAKT